MSEPTHPTNPGMEDAAQLFQQVFEHGRTPMWIACQADLRIRDVNQAATEQFGYSREEFLKNQLMFLVPEDERENFYICSERLISSDSPFFETHFRSSNGEVVDVRITARCLQFRKEACCLIEAVDVTEVHQAAAAQLTHQIFEKVLDSALDAFVVMNDKGVVLEWRGGSESTFGWSADEAVGRTVAELIVPDQYREAHWRGLEKFCQTGEGPLLGRRIEIEACNRAGKLIPVELEISVIRSSLGTRFGAFLRDLSERKAAEIALRNMNEELELRVQARTAELEAANREMEGFTYSVSHDLRSPLRAIMSTSMILKEDYAASLPQDAVEQLNRQAAAANKMGALIDDLLKLSRLGRQELIRKDLDMTQIAEEAFSEITANRDAKDFTFNAEPSLIATGDQNLLRLAIFNILDNAVKFSPSGGRIEFGKMATERGDAFFLRDQGIGFDPQYAHKMFLPFERLVLDSQFPGTGIGLANAKRIIERHGGALWAEGELGKGATFYFTVPLPPVGK